MKVFLPSNGLLGLTTVELRTPKIGDLRAIPNLSSSSILRKTQFVHQFVGDDVYKITPQDRDYLFFLVVGAITLNRIQAGIMCSCGQELGFTISVGEVDPLRLSRKDKKDFKFRSKASGEVFTLSHISVEDEVKIEERAMDLPDEDYQSNFEDGLVTRLYNLPLTEESVAKVRDLDISLYYAALLYHRTSPHGIKLEKQVKCPHCGKVSNLVIPVDGAMLNIDVAQIMDRYVSLRDYLSLDNYFDTTLPELNTFIDSLNRQLRDK